MQKLLEGSKLILEGGDFQDTARRIFDAARQITGAQSGYVALLSDNGEENEVLFLESGGLPCSVDPYLPMPVRGLRAEAYRTGRVAFDNDFMNSPWAGFMPAGHVDLRNVLFAPLNIKGKTVGIMGLANKPEGFTDDDGRVAEAFAQLAAIALHNSRNLEALRESESFLRMTGRMAKIGGWELNAKTMELRWTEETYRLHEVPPGYEPSLSTAVEFYHPDDRETLATAVQKALDHGEPYDMTVRFITAKGRRLWVATLGRAVMEDGKTVKLRGTFQDLTERRQMEERIKRSLREKELLLSEIHHRVKNNLQIVHSLINLQIGELNHGPTIRYLKDTQSRILAMAAIHEILYSSDDFAEINMRAYLVKIANVIFQSYGDGFAPAPGISAEEISLPLRQAVPVGLAVNEILTNAYKYAFPDRRRDGVIHIDLGETANKAIRLVIRDSGVGIPESLDWRNASSLGLKLAVLLVERQLEGTLELERGQGTTFTITFARSFTDE